MLLNNLTFDIPTNLLYLLLIAPGAHPASYTVGTGVLSPGVKQLGHEADHTSASSAKVKNKWSCTFSPTCFHGVQRVNFTLTFTLTILQYESSFKAICHVFK
jgi:hypothetical protein